MPEDGYFTTWSKYGLLGLSVGVIALLALRFQSEQSEAAAANMGQLYGILKVANEDAKQERADSRTERQQIMAMLLGVKTEAAAAKVAAATLKDDVKKVQATGETVRKELSATQKTVGEVKAAVDKIE